MNHNKVQEKVGGVMGGKVLDLPEFRVFREGKAEGLKEGKAEGLKEGLKEGEAERQQMAEKIEALQRELERIKKDKS